MGFFSDYETDDGTPYWGQQPPAPPRDPTPPSPPAPISLDPTVPVTPRAPNTPKDPNTGAGWRRDAKGKPYYYDPAAPEGHGREVAAADVKKTYIQGYDAKRDSFARRSAVNDQIFQQQAAQRPMAGQAPPPTPLTQPRTMRGQTPSVQVGAPGYGVPRIGQSPPPPSPYNPQQAAQSPPGYAPATAPGSAASAAFGSVYAQRTNRSLQRMGLNNATNANAIRR